MTLKDLIVLFRGLADDDQGRQLWSDKLLTLFANQAQREAARRARLLVDSTTAAVCTYPVKAGAHSIVLDKRVIFVRRVKVASLTEPLPKIRLADLDIVQPGWEDADVGTPVSYCADKTPGTLVFHPGFAAADTVHLTVVREPLNDMALSPQVDPELAPRHQDALVYWMLFRAFSKPDDPDAKDKQKAKDNLDLFEAEFGKPSSALDEQWIEERYGYDDFEGL